MSAIAAAGCPLRGQVSAIRFQASLPGDNRALEPPDPIPNSVVKRCIADGSVGFPHVRVGHRQAPKRKKGHPVWGGPFYV
mgnify:CR=1 FL=1